MGKGRRALRTFGNKVLKKQPCITNNLAPQTQNLNHYSSWSAYTPSRATLDSYPSCTSGLRSPQAVTAVMTMMRRKAASNSCQGIPVLRIVLLSTPIHVILVKHKNPDLDTMSRLSVGHLSVSKSSVRNPPSTPVSLPVVAFDQHDLLWSLFVFEVPAVVLVWQDRTRLSHPARMDQLDGQDILIRHRVRVADSQRVLVDGLDRAPHVDDLEARLQQAIGVLAQVARDLLSRCPLRLVDMCSLHRPALVVRARGCGVWSADRVVKDKKSRSPGTSSRSA